MNVVIDAASQASFEVGARHVPLEGVVNFRDLGGYVTTSGRRLRWGQIFRSDVLAELSDRDMIRLQQLGLRTVCDLRASSERLNKPNRDLRSLGVSYHAMGFMPYRGDELLADTKAGSIAIAEIESRVREIYRRFVTDQCDTYARLLQMLEAEPLPMLIHCTSGRDRTGFASAVILMALDVPRATIAEDYALSNEFRRDLTFQVGADVDAAVMHTLTNANRDYLAAAFKAIDDGWGSDQAYLRQALRLSDEGRSRLAERLLE